MRMLMLATLALAAAVVLAPAAAGECNALFQGSGVTVDLRPLQGTTVSTSDDAFLYKVALCEAPDSSCASKSAVACQEYKNLIAQALGVVDAAETELVDDEVVMTFEKGDRCGSDYYATQITFVCDSSATGDGKLAFKGENSCLVKFQWSSVHACPKPAAAAGAAKKKGLSTGSILTIIFFVVLVVYVGAGMAFRFRFRDARGLDMLPNRAFWAAVPGLVADGCKFTYHTIRGLVSGGDSYSTLE